MNFKVGLQRIFKFSPIALALLTAVIGLIPLAQVDFFGLIAGVIIFISENISQPSFSNQALLQATLETLSIAFVGTSIGFGSALLYSRLPSWNEYWFLKSVGNISTISIRAIPDLVFALVLVQIFGIGPVAGSLAIAMGTFGVSAKLIRESQASEAYNFEKQIRLLGVRPIAALVTASASASQDLIPQFLFRLEANLRIATIIGVAGGGGLGELLRAAFGTFDYGNGITVIAITAALILLAEFTTLLIKRLLTERSKIVMRPETTLSLWLTPFTLSICLLVYWQSSSQTFRINQLYLIISEMLRVDFISFGRQIFEGLLQSIQMTLSASIIAFILGSLLAILSSAYLGPTKLVSAMLRVFLAAGRGIPTIVIAIVLVTQIGLGYLPALVAIVIGLCFFVARVVADAIDANPKKTIESFQNAGVTKLQIAFMLLFGLMKLQVRRIIFFILDFAFRYTVILGLVGAGGLGSVISGAIRVQDFGTLSACLLVVVAAIGALEFLSRTYLVKTGKYQ